MKAHVEKKAFVLSLIGVFVVLSMFSTANAQTIGNKEPAAFGFGTFRTDIDE